MDQTLARAAARRAQVADAEADSLLLALHYADLNAAVEPPAGGEIVPGIERLRVYGGEGCPAIAEFCAQEFGWRLGMSGGAAAAYLGEALALRHRFPKTLAQVLAGNAEAWKARWIARTCLSLSLEAARIVDDKVNAIIDTLSLSRLRVFVKAAKMQADPDKAKADADQYARQHGVWLGQSNDHGTKSLVARTAAGDAIRFDAAVEELAEILAEEGDTGTHQQRRARAVGLLADPALALGLREHGRSKARRTAAQSARPTDSTCATARPSRDEYDIGDDGARAAGGPRQPVDGLLAGITSRNRSRGLGHAPHTFYVHISQEALASGEGIVRVEGMGPMLVSQLKGLIASEAVALKPVIDLREHLSVNAYEIPDRMREWVKLRYPTPMEPWATGETTSFADIDHAVPYDKNGPPGQTSTKNLLPVTRTPHRAKTHGGLRNVILPDGSVEWTTPRGARYLVDHNGTHYIGQVDLITGELISPPRPRWKASRHLKSVEPASGGD
ncbi:DUF222 domain-containing protein [Kribbella deserti]|uniref:DUF222 domain-containing protein n=1 Tax=Kribbella deserti TaxID=1926257 RepID=A0ABV6QID3_9ACTN